MNKKILLIILFFISILSYSFLAQAKKPLVAKGDKDTICGVANVSQTIQLEVVDERAEKIVMDKDVMGHFKVKTTEGLKSCGYRIAAQENSGVKKLKLILTDLSVDKDAGKIASRMDATASLKAIVMTDEIESYNTLLTASSSRTQPFVGHVIKKGKWALKLMEELAASVASDSPLNSELVK